MFELNTLATGLRFKADTLNRRWSNASLLVHRSFDGHIVSMRQSGAHWLRNMLASVLIQLYDLPALKHIQDDSIIGHTKSPPIYKHIPQIVHSHGCPHALTMRVPGLHFPKYLVLVRELRESLISHYERFKGDYGDADFSVFLRGDFQKKKYHSDIWTRIRFMNEWGRMLKRYPDRINLVRYEDIKQDPSASLRQVCDFFDIQGVTDDVIKRAIRDSHPEQMASKPNPSVTTTVVRTGERKPVSAYFDVSNQEFFERIVGQYLQYDFGYEYSLRKARTMEISPKDGEARVFVTTSNDKSPHTAYTKYPPLPIVQRCAKCHCDVVVSFDSRVTGLMSDCKKDICAIASQLPPSYCPAENEELDGIRVSVREANE